LGFSTKRARERWKGGFENAFGFGPGDQGFSDHPHFERHGGHPDEYKVPLLESEPTVRFEKFDPHGESGKEEHEDSWNSDEENGEVASPHPEGNDQKSEAAEELIGCAEKGPKDESALPS